MSKYDENEMALHALTGCEDAQRRVDAIDVDTIDPVTRLLTQRRAETIALTQPLRDCTRSLRIRKQIAELETELVRENAASTTQSVDRLETTSFQRVHKLLDVQQEFVNTVVIPNTELTDDQQQFQKYLSKTIRWAMVIYFSDPLNSQNVHSQFSQVMETTDASNSGN